MVTIIDMSRGRPITKEEMEYRCQEKDLHHDKYSTKDVFQSVKHSSGFERDLDHTGGSINDDIEVLFENLRLGNYANSIMELPSFDSFDEFYFDSHYSDGITCTYFLPKLTKKEVTLIEKNDSSYLETFLEDPEYWNEPYVAKADPKLSESKSKFVKGYCYRHTFRITNMDDLTGRFGPYPWW